MKDPYIEVTYNCDPETQKRYKAMIEENGFDDFIVTDISGPGFESIEDSGNAVFVSGEIIWRDIDEPGSLQSTDEIK